MRARTAHALAAYALGAVGGAEARAIRAALAADSRLRHEADAYGDTASRLLARLEPVEPDADVWHRVQAAISSGESEPPPTPRWRPSAMALAAAAAAFLLGVSAATVLRGEPPADVAAVATELAADPSTATLRLADPGSGAVVATVLVGADGTAVFSGERLPALDDALTYQLWAVVDGQVVSAGLLGAEPTAAALRLEAEPTLLAVTVERAGGVVVSEQEPVAAWSAEA